MLTSMTQAEGEQLSIALSEAGVTISVHVNQILWGQVAFSIQYFSRP